MRSTSFFAALTTSMTSVAMSSAESWTLYFVIVTASAFFWSNGFFFITPGRTVAIAGRKRGQTMDAIRLPPNAGRVIFRPLETSCASIFSVTLFLSMIVPSFSMRSSGSVDAPRRKFL